MAKQNLNYNFHC